MEEKKIQLQVKGTQSLIDKKTHIPTVWQDYMQIVRNKLIQVVRETK